ncbi:MAG: hypothetical protein WAN36_14375 [Calditrichia bacterium]
MEPHSKYKKLKFDKIKTYSIQDRYSKVKIKDFCQPENSSTTIGRFIDSLPAILAGSDFKKFCGQYRKAVQMQKTTVWMLGAHVIKCGLSPVLIRMMKKGFIQHLALNGAGAIHDVELAMWGITSEDVSAGLKDGSFGMAAETAEFINGALSENKGNEKGYAECIAEKLNRSSAPNLEISLLALAYQLNIPVTLHPALGTEIIHQHPGLDGAAFGEKALLDFRLFSQSLSKLSEDAVVVNAGSAVIMPEVFLKALTIVRNLGFPAFRFHTAVFDMNRHYRPLVNVVQRPTQEGGKGFYFIGHHEIMIPLLAAAIQD